MCLAARLPLLNGGGSRNRSSSPSASSSSSSSGRRTGLLVRDTDLFSVAPANVCCCETVFRAAGCAAGFLFVVLGIAAADSSMSGTVRGRTCLVAGAGFIALRACASMAGASAVSCAWIAAALLAMRLSGMVGGAVVSGSTAKISALEAFIAMRLLGLRRVAAAGFVPSAAGGFALAAGLRPGSGTGARCMSADC